jgi:hypothetical protein
MIVYVTKTDIKNGKRSAPGSCPVALALDRATDEACSVERTQMWIGGHFIMTPPSVRRKIDAFDDGQGMIPFKFGIEYEKS